MQSTTRAAARQQRKRKKSIIKLVVKGEENKKVLDHLKKRLEIQIKNLLQKVQNINIYT